MVDNWLLNSENALLIIDALGYFCFHAHVIAYVSFHIVLSEQGDDGSRYSSI